VAEAADQRIADQILQMLQATRADVEQPHHQYEVRRCGTNSMGKSDGQITLDRSPQTPYLQAHQRGLLAAMDDVGTSLHSMRGQALWAFRRQFARFTNFGSGLEVEV
jgi:hypothetical protein